jgi:hypothetical protein
MKHRVNKIRYNCGLIFLAAIFAVAIILCNNDITQAKVPPDSLNADISVKTRPLKEVVDLIQEQTGYKVQLKSIDESFLVTGQYHNTAVETIFTRLLKGYNISVTTNTADKLISVISLGGKIQVAKNSKESETDQNVAADVDSSLPDKVAPAESAEIAPLPVLPNKDIEKLQAQQVKEFERQQNDPNTVDPITGMTLSALEDLQKKQIMESNKDVK